MIQEQLNDKRGIALSLVNIGQIYCNMGFYSKALTYHMRCLDIREHLGMTKWIGLSCMLIGEIYLYERNYKEALFYFSNQNPSGLIIDLRGNSGGLLNNAIKKSILPTTNALTAPKIKVGYI